MKQQRHHDPVCVSGCVCGWWMCVVLTVTAAAAVCRPVCPVGGAADAQQQIWGCNPNLPLSVCSQILADVLMRRSQALTRTRSHCVESNTRSEQSVVLIRSLTAAFVVSPETITCFIVHRWQFKSSESVQTCSETVCTDVDRRCSGTPGRSRLVRWFMVPVLSQIQTRCQQLVVSDAGEGKMWKRSSHQTAALLPGC